VRKTAILVRLPEALKARAEAAARDSGQPTAHLIVRALEDALRERDVLDRLLENPSYRTQAHAMLTNFDRAGREAARDKGISEQPEVWMRDSECYRAAIYAAAGLMVGTARGKAAAKARSVLSTGHIRQRRLGAWE
jgi:hypothetical protein